MKLTAEQEFLKALAEWLDIETIPKNRIQEASREYLDQFVSVNEKVEPEWTPEVGGLYKRKINGVITEIVEIQLINGKRYISHEIIDFDYSKCLSHRDAEVIFAQEYEPIAELEGLNVGYTVYTYGNDGKVHSFFIEGKFPFDDFITIKGTQGGYRINITLDGYFPIISNKQLFWRTADRAERFGRV